MLWSGLSQAIVTRIGPRKPMAVGLALMGIGTVLYTQVPVDGHFAGDLLPGYLVYAAGMAFSFIPVSIAALSGVKEEEAGLASGLFNTNQQIGGALGVAIAASVATSRLKSLQADGKSLAEAATGGYHYAFWVLAGFSFAGALIALLAVRDSEPGATTDAKPVATTL